MYHSSCPNLFLCFFFHKSLFLFFFFFNDTATTEIYTLSLHDALPIYRRDWLSPLRSVVALAARHRDGRSEEHTSELQSHLNLVCRLLLEKKKEQVGVGKLRFKSTQIEIWRVASSTSSGLSTGTHTAQASSACTVRSSWCAIFFFNDTATTEIYTLSLHDALPI